MKNKFLLVAVIGVLFVAGAVLVSCGFGCPGDGNCKTVLDNCSIKASSAYSTKDAEKAVDCLAQITADYVAQKDPSCIC